MEKHKNSRTALGLLNISCHTVFLRFWPVYWNVQIYLMFNNKLLSIYVWSLFDRRSWNLRRAVKWAMDKNMFENGWCEARQMNTVIFYNFLVFMKIRVYLMHLLSKLYIYINSISCSSRIRYKSNFSHYEKRWLFVD